jgi:Putative  PD-(D/E)XK family member, (DUF4420)
MKSVFKIFQELKAEINNKSDGFVIASLPAVKNHKIGVSAEELPMFFIKCDEANATKLLDYNLEFIAIQFNRECRLISNGNQSAKGFYTVISLKTDSIDLQEYFLEIVFLIVKNLPPLPTLKELKFEVEKLINLFSQFSKPPQKTIQGLWAELLVIEQAKQPDYLIKAWHNETTDKFDFNDGIDKIEVKSTMKSKRVHSFSIEQLNPNKNSNLLIASVFTTETGTGTSIFDLLELIGKKIKDKNLFFRLNEITAKTLGKEFEKTFDVFFDYQLAADSLEFYESNLIPKIDIATIPKQLSNIRFDSDLSEIEPLKQLKTNSLLHQSVL